VDHPSGFARVKYDPRGRITEAVQSVSAKAGANTVPIQTTVKYAYSHGDLMTITYPSGRVLVITRDTGELIGMSLAKDAGSTPVPLISNVKWEPFGSVSGWDWHMTSGLVPHMRQFDLSGRIVRYPLGSVLRDVSYDAADRITGFTHLSANDGTPQSALNQGFAYDENSRLTSITTNAASWSIAYDPNGNRTSVSLNGSQSDYTTEATSNRLTSITNPARSFTYDNAGNTTVDSANYTATYGLNGAIASITKAGVTGSYDYDADRRRIRKVTSTGGVVIFAYNLEGQLLGEYDQTGKPLREYVWLDNIPVAMFMPDPTNASNPPLIYYIHADHLNTPRIVVDQSGAKRWRWLAEPFGTTAPEANPDGLGTFTQNLRFPGQYADAESGLWYNHFRTLDSLRGSYTQPDPIGLAGGINTYVYVAGNPSQYTDSSGLRAEDVLLIDRYLKEHYADINRRGGYQFGTVDPKHRAETLASSGITILPASIRCKDLSYDEFHELFGTMLHESMHSTDSPSQVRWDGLADFFEFVGVPPTENHQGIYNRVVFETFNGHRMRPQGPIWGRPSDFVPKISELYRESRRKISGGSCGCP
jgi:RHS repeat-associated protein